MISSNKSNTFSFSQMLDSKLKVLFSRSHWCKIVRRKQAETPSSDTTIQFVSVSRFDTNFCFRPRCQVAWALFIRNRDPCRSALWPRPIHRLQNPSLLRCGSSAYLHLPEFLRTVPPRHATGFCGFQLMTEPYRSSPCQSFVPKKMFFLMLFLVLCGSEPFLSGPRRGFATRPQLTRKGLRLRGTDRCRQLQRERYIPACLV